MQGTRNSAARIHAIRRTYLKQKKHKQQEGRFLKKPISGWSTPKLLAIGSSCFIVGGFYLAMLGDVVPDLIKESNRVALRDWWPLGFLLWFFVAIVAAFIVYPFASFAQKCHEAIVRRFLG